MKAFADWDLCDLHANTDVVMGEGADVGAAELCWEQGSCSSWEAPEQQAGAYF